VVAIGASAGGLAAFTSLLKSLPPRSGMAFVLIQHLEPKHESALATLLSKATAMPVIEASDGLAVEANHVYVIPPNKSMTIRKGALRLAPRSNIAGPQWPIDDFSVALAEEHGNRAIGVVLSGTGSDGTYGLKTIKAAGGVTLVQDPKSTRWPAMPMNAITAGATDFILSPKRIALQLARIGRHPYVAGTPEEPDGSELDKIYRILRSSVGVDFRLYKQTTAQRRIARRMALQKIESLNQYAQILNQNADEAKALADDIFIHVTSFFRDPECFQALRKQVLKRLGLKRPAEDSLRIWVAGCSSGEEVYSIAMLVFEEFGERANRMKIHIFGTDIQERAVEHARTGIYTQAALAGVSPARLQRFFVKTDHGYQIQQLVRERCVFARHDLAQDPPLSRLDLITCRNVLIYAGQALRKKILSIFQFALRPGGYLFLGNSESISGYADIFTAEDRKHRIFTRKSTAAAFQEFNASFREVEAAPKTGPASAAVDLGTEVEQILLEQYAPPAIVVDPDLHIVHVQGDTTPYLVPATGRPSFHLLKMVHPELAVDLRSAIFKARREGVTVIKDHVPYRNQGQPRAVRLEVHLLSGRDAKKPDLLVVFQKIEPLGPPDEGRKTGRITSRRDSAGKVAKLERENAEIRKRVCDLMLEHNTAQEATRWANEEFLSSNEELQTTNEELESAREELQSSNEELVTLNDELQHRNTELNVLTQDLTNLLVGVEIPVLVLDAEMRIRRFTPLAGTLLNLISGDVGRPFSNIASNLDVADWKGMFSEVTSRGLFLEHEVSSRDGHRYSMRMRPYKISDNDIEGVVVVLVDTEALSQERDKAQESGDFARKELGKRESTIKALLEASPQAILGVTADEKIVLVNGTTEKMFGYRPEELIGQSLETLVPPEAQDRHVEHHRIYFGDMASRPRAAGLDLAGRRKDGTLFPIEVGLSVVETPAGKLGCAFVTDITQRRQMEQAAQAHALEIRESEERFHNMADTAPVMIWVAGPDKLCTFFNRGWLEFTGRTLDQEMGNGWAESVHPEDLDRSLDIYSSSFDAHRAFKMEYRLRRADGEYRWVLDNGVPRFDSSGGLLGYIGSGVDITDLTLAHQEHLATQKMETVGALAGGVAHDFNNLLGGILAQSELALSELDSGSRPLEELRRIRDSAIRGAEIVRQLMVYAGEEPEVLELVDVSVFVHEMLELLKVSVSKHVRVETDFGQQVLAIRVNPAQIRQIIMNLFHNASEAIGDEDGVIRVITRLVTVSPESPLAGSMPAGNYVQLEISDTGRGMTLEVQAKAFDPFFTTKATGSHGHGLVIVKRIVERHHGSIRLSSAPGQGATFQIMLPSQEQKFPPTHGATEGPTDETLPSRVAKILIVEDEDPLRHAVSTILHKKGYGVIEASDGCAALEIIRAQKGDIDLLLLDLTLPGATSREVYDEARRLRPDLPVIVASAKSEKLAKASLGMGIKRFLGKPFSVDELIKIIQEVLSS